MNDANLPYKKPRFEKSLPEAGEFQPEADDFQPEAGEMQPEPKEAVTRGRNSSEEVEAEAP